MNLDLNYVVNIRYAIIKNEKNQCWFNILFST